jgi:hypothetical protein
MSSKEELLSWLMIKWLKTIGKDAPCLQDGVWTKANLPDCWCYNTLIVFTSLLRTPWIGTDTCCPQLRGVLNAEANWMDFIESSSTCSIYTETDSDTYRSRSLTQFLVIFKVNRLFDAISPSEVKANCYFHFWCVVGMSIFLASGTKLWSLLDG